MITAAAYAVALTAVGWSQWVRRGTWRIPWESPTTAAILLLGLALILIAPDAQPITGRALFEVTGRWHVDDMLGHIIEAAALGLSTLAGFERMPSMRQRIVPLLQWPFTFAVALMIALFAQSRVSHDRANDMFKIADHHWMAAYFAVLWTLLIYYGALNAWVALEFRRDPRSRRVARAWLLGLGFGAVAMFGWLWPWLGLTHWYDAGRIAMCAAVTVFSISSALSWQRKLDPWRGLIRATGARL